MAIREWLSYYPGMLDNTTSSGMPDLTNESAPGVGDGDTSRVSQIHSVRDAIIAVEAELGTTTTESGSVRWRVLQLETSPVNATQLRGRTISTTLPTVSGQALVWNSVSQEWVPELVTGGSSSSVKYNEEVWHLLGTETPGSAQTRSLSVQPVVSTNSVSGFAVEMYREGLRMEPVTTVSGYMGFKYNNTLFRVEYKAPGSNDLYQLVYWSE